MEAGAQKVCGGANGVLHSLANEPTLGLYYVVDHVQRSGPHLVETKRELQRSTEALRSAELDAGYALENMRSATDGRALRSFESAGASAAAATAAAEALARAGTPVIPVSEQRSKGLSVKGLSRPWESPTF